MAHLGSIPIFLQQRMISRLIFLIMSLAMAACTGGGVSTSVKSSPTGTAKAAGHTLPLATRFQGMEKFHLLCRRATAENWAALPLGERTTRVALALVGTPYVSWTLEIDDHIEAPSVNFLGLDCWTAYEIPLAFARMIQAQPAPWQPEDLLQWIEKERYRDGHCDGTYLSRMHYLEEVFHNNARRGLVENITARLPGAVPLQRRISDMSAGWPQYRYLLANPKLVGAIAQMEARVSALPVFYIPKNRVAAIEPMLKSGDILAICGNYASSYTTHVGLAVAQADGSARFLHATSSRDKGRKVILDGRISEYLNESNSHAGLIVCRPIR